MSFTEKKMDTDHRLIRYELAGPKNASRFLFTNEWLMTISAACLPRANRNQTKDQRCQVSERRAGPFVTFPARLEKERLCETSDLSVIITPLPPHKPKPSGGDRGERAASHFIFINHRHVKS